MKYLKLFLIAIVSFVILLPAVFFNWKTNYISEIDNRKLTEFPKLDKVNSDTIKDVYKFINDRIGFREEIIQGYGKINDKLFNILVHPAYVYGQDGYVYFGLYQKSYDEHTKQFTKSLKDIKDYVEARGGKFYVLINPEKTSVYTEHLPKGVNYNRTWMENIENDLKSYGINFLDNTDELKKRSSTEQVYNKKYDAGHWNDIGAFYGVNNLLEMIGRDYPNVKPHNIEDFNTTKEVRKYLPTSKFEVNEEVPVLTLKQQYNDLTEKYDKEVKRDIQQNHFSYIKGNNTNLPRALVFQGSYLNGREKYLADRFSQYIAVHNYQNIFDIDYYYNMFQPDIVVFEVAEYTINNTYFTSEKMGNMKLNPALQTTKYTYEGVVQYSLEKGNAIDKLIFKGLPDDIEYAYLKIRDKVYDIKFLDGEYILSVDNALLTLNGEEEIIFTRKNDDKYYKSKIKEEKNK